MKLIISNPSAGTTKTIELEDDVLRKANLSDYRMGQEVDGHIFGQAFAGYRFRITGGQDKDGFAMKQGVMSAARVMLLMKPGNTGYAKWRARTGERKRRSVRGCILGNDLACVSVIISKRGEKTIEGLTDVTQPRRLGPKRANKIRKLFGLSNQQITKYVLRRKLPEVDRSAKELPNKNRYSKAPKIQRLIEPAVKRRRANKLKEKKERAVVSSQARKEFISLILAKRRDQRLKKVHKRTVKERYNFRKIVSKVKEARCKAVEKARKSQNKSKNTQQAGGKVAVSGKGKKGKA